MERSHLRAETGTCTISGTAKSASERQIGTQHGASFACNDDRVGVDERGSADETIEPRRERRPRSAAVARVEDLSVKTRGYRRETVGRNRHDIERVVSCDADR